jgi:hypothetical protein
MMWPDLPFRHCLDTALNDKSELHLARTVGRGTMLGRGNGDLVTRFSR